MIPFKYFLFDYDGTLCHTENTIDHAIIETFKKYKLEVPNEQKRLDAISSGITIREAIVSLHSEGKTIDQEQLNTMVKCYRGIYNEIDSKYTTLFDGAAALLSKLKERNKTIIVLSNKGLQTVSNSLDFFDLAKYVDLVIADGSPAMENLKMKPSPASYISVIKKQFMIQNDNETIMTGDTYADLLFAKNCGIRSCWASYGYGDQQACRELKPDYLINTLTDFHKIIN